MPFRTVPCAVVVALAGVAATGCEYVTRVRGVVHAPTSSGTAPLAAATIKVTCPGRAPQTATTNEQGVFDQIISSKRYDRRCTVDVNRPGFKAKSVVLGDVCGESPKDEPREYCPVISTLDLQLEPLEGS
jgi:hypothetical protein